MFFREIRLKTNKTHKVTLAEVHLPVRLGHRDPVKLFADPLKDQLAAAGLGTVLDCRPRKRTSGEVIGVDLSLGLTDTSKATFETVTAMLEHLMIPCGASIRHSDGPGTPHLFGRAEGLEVSIDAAIAPDAEARRELATLCIRALDTLAISRGWDETDGQTRLYFYGDDYTTMETNLSPVLASHPLYAAANINRMA